MSKKKLAIVVAIILIILGILFTIGRNSTQMEITAIAEKKANGTYEIYNTDIDTTTGSTKIMATVKNISGVKTPEKLIDIVLLDKDENEIGTIKTTVPSLENGVATMISAESLKEYENVYDFEIR